MDREKHLESIYNKNNYIVKFMQKTLDSLTSHIAILDKEGTIIFVNQSWRSFAEKNGFLFLDHGVGANYIKVC